MAPHSGNCTTCGLPLAGPTCRSCGGTSRSIALADGAASAASAFAPDPARPELDLAYEAWAAGDLTRVVSQCLSAEGAEGASMQQGADGPIFKALCRGLAMFIRLRADGQVELEVPVVRLPLTHYTAALRLLLELSDRDEVPVRFSTRGELAIARFVGRLGAMSPSALCAALRATTSSAGECARLLVGALQARELTPDEHADLTIEALPVGLLLDLDGPGSSIPLRRPQQGAPLGSLEPLVGPSGGAPQEVPPVLMPKGGVQHTPPPRGKVPTPARIGRPTPGVLPLPGPGAKAARAPSEGPRAALAPPTTPAAQAPRAPLVPPPKAAPAPQPQQGVGRTMVSADAMANTSPSAGLSGFPPPPPDPLGDTFIGSSAGSPPPKTGSSAADALAELLHKAQTLGAVLSFADQPATMCLLIRATVYRAIQEVDPTVSDAVALLYAETQPLIREIYITAPGKRRGSMAIPPTSPAFEVMARIVAQGCAVSGSPPLQVQPITTAQDAKQHLARYVSEIDQAPSDPDLRHFLALGALCELLARTKLPPATQDRLRGIVAHAKKEGAKQAVVDLMMTALTRMIA